MSFLTPISSLKICKASMWQERIKKATLKRRNLPFLTLFKQLTLILKFLLGDTTRHIFCSRICLLELTAIIQASFLLPLASHFYFLPFKLFHRSPSGVEEQVFSEVYNSDVFIEEHINVQHAPLPPDQPDCKQEKVLVALMVWSNSTHLANFGTAKLWPIYFLFGNVSKYIHGQPNSGACQHIAYIPSLPDAFQDFATSFCSKWGTQKRDLMTHCRRELMHGVWKFLLDADFIHAYKFGNVLMVLSIGYILDSLHILLIILRSKWISFIHGLLS